MTALQFGIALLVNSANDSNFRSFLVDQANPILSLTIIVGGAFSLFGTLLEFRDGISRLPIQRRPRHGATHVELVDNRVGRNLYGSSAHPNSSGDRSPRRLLIGLSPSKRSSVCCDPIETLLY